MSKNRGKLFVILLIVFIGIAVTFFTNKIVGDPATASTESQSIVSSVLIPSGQSSSTEQAEIIEGEVGVVDGRPKNKSGSVSEDEEQAKETVLSPLEAAPAEDSAPPLGETEAALGYSSEQTVSTYKQRLDEVSVQVEKMKTENREYNRYTAKSMADTELKLWDSELNLIYNAILDGMASEEKEPLIKEEREWLLERDFAAAQTSESYGGSMESVEYTASLAASTKSRCYELVEKYGTYLQ